MKILVVDDESAALSNFFAEILDDPNYDYKMLRDPEIALNYAKNNKTDAAFLDINMPKLNGIKLAEKLIELNPHIGIVFISGYAHNESEITARLGKNLKGFCRKPYGSDELYRYLFALADHSPKKVVLRTFGLFDVSLHGKSIRFSSTKSKELFALLVDKARAHVPLDTSVAMLWPDKPVDLAKRLYRDAVIRIKLTMEEHGLDDLIFYYRAELAINRARADCDLWRALETNNYSEYHGEYMTQFAEWSSERQHILDSLKLNTIKII